MRQHFKVPHILNTNREYILLSFCRAVCRCPSSCNFESCVDVPNCSTSITWCLRSCVVWFIAVLSWCRATVYKVQRLYNVASTVLTKIGPSELTQSHRHCMLFHQGFVYCSIKGSYTVLPRFRTAPCRVCTTLSQTEHVLSRFWPKTVQDQPNISTL